MPRLIARLFLGLCTEVKVSLALPLEWITCPIDANVAWMWVGMQEGRLQELHQVCFCRPLSHQPGVNAGRAQRCDIRDLDARHILQS